MDLKKLQRQLKSKPTQSRIITDDKRKTMGLDLSDRQTLPMSYMEEELDRIFGALFWKYEIVGEIRLVPGLNVVECSVHLSVWNKEIQQWVSRPGHASAQVKIADYRTGTMRSDDYTKSSAGVLSLAFKNAAKKLGIRFGRELNRNYEDLLYFQDAETVN